VRENDRMMAKLIRLPRLKNGDKSNFGIMKTNCFSVTSYDGDVSATKLVLFPKVARINHSCAPNCHHYWSPKLNCFIVRAVKDIDEVNTTVNRLIHYHQ